MQPLTNEERETHISMVASDRSYYEIYSDDPVMMTRIEKAEAELVREHHGGGRTYRLPAKQLTIRKPVRITEQERERMRQAALERFHGEPSAPR